jgi:hypothetical protein
MGSDLACNRELLIGDYVMIYLIKRIPWRGSYTVLPRFLTHIVGYARGGRATPALFTILTGTPSCDKLDEGVS